MFESDPVEVEVNFTPIKQANTYLNTVWKTGYINTVWLCLDGLQ